MQMFFCRLLVKCAFILSFVVLAGHSFSGTNDTREQRPYKERILKVQSLSFPGVIQVAAHMRFDKILGVIGGSDISYGDISPSAHERIVIMPDGTVSSENSNALTASSRSHPGEITIHDGREQQFKLIANRYTSNGLIRPIKALCSFQATHNVPCDKISSSKQREPKKVYMGMVIQVLDNLHDQKTGAKPSFDLSVVYL